MKLDNYYINVGPTCSKKLKLLMSNNQVCIGYVRWSEMSLIYFVRLLRLSHSCISYHSIDIACLFTAALGMATLLQRQLPVRPSKGECDWMGQQEQPNAPVGAAAVALGATIAASSSQPRKDKKKQMQPPPPPPVVRDQRVVLGGRSSSSSSSSSNGLYQTGLPW